MHLLVRLLWLVLVLVLICQGALQCFSPGTLKRLQNRLPRTYNPETRGGKYLEGVRTKKPSIAHRIVGLLLMFVGLFLLLATLGVVR